MKVNNDNKKLMKNIKQSMFPKKESKTTNETIIVAPHLDDEIIGCYEILINENIKPIIIYSDFSDDKRRSESLTLRNYVELKGQIFMDSIPANLIDKTNTYYFPNPIYETHPLHRIKGISGEGLLRNGFNVIFYSTEMNYHAKYECKDPKGKRDLLNKVYPSQSNLWKYENKFWLFSCYEKWLINI